MASLIRGRSMWLGSTVSEVVFEMLLSTTRRGALPSAITTPSLPLGHSSHSHASVWDRCTRRRVFRERVDRYRNLIKCRHPHWRETRGKSELGGKVLQSHWRQEDTPVETRTVKTRTKCANGPDLRQVPGPRHRDTCLEDGIESSLPSTEHRRERWNCELQSRVILNPNPLMIVQKGRECRRIMNITPSLPTAVRLNLDLSSWMPPGTCATNPDWTSSWTSSWTKAWWSRALFHEDVQSCKGIGSEMQSVLSGHAGDGCSGWLTPRGHPLPMYQETQHQDHALPGPYVSTVSSEKVGPEWSRAHHQHGPSNPSTEPSHKCTVTIRTQPLVGRVTPFLSVQKSSNSPWSCRVSETRICAAHQKRGDLSSPHVVQCLVSPRHLRHGTSVKAAEPVLGASYATYAKSEIDPGKL